MLSKVSFDIPQPICDFLLMVNLIATVAVIVIQYILIANIANHYREGTPSNINDYTEWQLRPCLAFLSSSSFSTTTTTHIEFYPSSKLELAKTRGMGLQFFHPEILTALPRAVASNKGGCGVHHLHKNPACNRKRFLPCDAMWCTVFVVVILSVCLSVCLSVRPSVCLSHSCTVSTWFDLRSWFLHHMVAPSF